MKVIYLCHDLQSQIGKHEFTLEQAGYDVKLFHNGGDLVRAIAQGEPDLVVMDVLLEGKNGFEVCEGLDLAENQRFPVVLIAGIYRRPVFRNQALSLGVTEFVDGNLDDIDLLGTVSRVLNQFEEGTGKRAA